MVHLIYVFCDFCCIANLINALPCLSSFDFFREVIAEGKQLEYIDEYVGPFLLEWLPGLLTSPQSTDALSLIIILVKFNSAYLDEPVVTGYVK